DVCTAAAAQVAAAVPADDLTVRVVARAESLESPLALAAVADLMARREDDASAARLAKRAIDLAGAKVEDNDNARASSFAQIATALAPTQPDMASAAAREALTAGERIGDSFWRAFALEEIVPALEAVADADGLARVWQVAIGDDDRDQVFATLAGAYGRRGEKEQALAAVEAIPPGDGSFQTAALREVSMGLAAADRIDDALAVAPLVPSAAERAAALA